MKASVLLLSALILVISVTISTFALSLDPRLYGYEALAINYFPQIVMSFSSFINLVLFFISGAFLLDTKRAFFSELMDSSAIALLVTNYLNFGLIALYSKALVYPVPLFMITSSNYNSISLDWGQVVIILEIIKYRKKISSMLRH
jgi:hypothetical protein